MPLRALPALSRISRWTSSTWDSSVLSGGGASFSTLVVGNGEVWHSDALGTDDPWPLPSRTIRPSLPVLPPLRLPISALRKDGLGRGDSGFLKEDISLTETRAMVLQIGVEVVSACGQYH